MKATGRGLGIYRKDEEIVPRNENSTVNRFSHKTGETVMTSYGVFPGIELIYNDVHAQSCRAERADSGNIIKINHCREGRVECEFQGEFCYLSEGDLLIARNLDAGGGSYFPLSHYHGITIKIDVDKAPKCFSCFLDDVNVSPAALACKFCSDGKCFVSRGEPYAEHIFSELYYVPKSIQKGYFKVKILELLLFLSAMDVKKDQSKAHCIPKAHVCLAKRVNRYLSEHMEERITLDQLSALFHVSGTQIKNSFKAVYGVSVYAFIRTQKMQGAALLLRHTDRTILDIAGSYGYDNGSKFAKAFKDTMGVAPKEYRCSAANH